jgi:L-iditol 2-dehydrogenase
MKANKVRSAVLETNQKIVVKDLPEEKLLATQCQVKIKAAGLCSSDIARSYGGSSYFYPIVMGHELAGEIIQVGDDANHQFSIGDKVCIFPLIPCFKCSSCEQKIYALCKDYSYYGSRRNGGFAERLNVNHWNLLKMPDGASFEDCALVEPTAVALHAVEKLNLNSKSISQICILGAGFISLMAVQIINEFYPQCRVTIVDRNKYKLDIAKKYSSVSKWVGNLKSWDNFLIENENKFDNVVELVGDPKTFTAALHIASQTGKVVWAGNISDDLEISKLQVSSILRKELTILGTWNSIFKGEKTCDWKRTLNLISKGLKPSELITSKINLEQIDEILGKLYAHKNREKEFMTIKVMVNPNG